MACVPVNSSLEAFAEVSVLWLPAKLAGELAVVDGVALVMARAVSDVFIGSLILAHELEESLDDVLIVLFAIGADQVEFARYALVENGVDG